MRSKESSTPVLCNCASRDFWAKQLYKIKKHTSSQLGRIIDIIAYLANPRATKSFQRRCKLVEGWMAKPIWTQADPRFVWNINLLDKLIEYKVRLSIFEVIIS
ncbi:hypothetical protein DVH24_036165 [Malus domestica]|uniref:SAC domain-containing protein n=1 Tax=Malus domestica TaxID=3750 RepID=A0A498II35_MALDO|nr:hypothetical protein DVH24_036165 [Malus domestica]